MEKERTSTPAYWTATEKILFRLAALFLPLWALTLPYPHDLLPDPGRWLMPLTAAAARFTGEHLFRLRQPFTAEVLSDSTGAYLHSFNLLVVCLLGTVLWTVLDRQRPHYRAGLYWLLAFARYFLALMLLEYGFAKVFKTQFYQPEPNTLFTPLGELTRDIAYWSVVGSSRSYNLFMGISEVIPAVLLLFRRTRLAGALLSVAVMVNVLAVNMSFFISVKLFSSYLLLLALVVALPDLRRLIDFFLRGQSPAPAALWQPSFPHRRGKLAFASAKTILILLIAAEVLYPFAKSGNFSDDRAPRPPGHGAYHVLMMVAAGDTLAPSLEEPLRWHRMFIHRQGYFITQRMDGSLQDYRLRTDDGCTQMQMEHTRTNVPGHFLRHSLGDSIFRFEGNVDGMELDILARQLPHGNLPLLKEDFSWTIDSYKNQ